MIIRTHHSKDNPYVLINCTVLHDPRLSWKATGLGAYLLSKPDNWQANIRHLSNQKTDGYDAVSAGLKELETHFYLARSRSQNPDTGKIEWVVDFYESYELNPAWRALSDEERSAQTVQAAQTGAKTEEESPRVENPVMDDPRTENPIMENPRTDFPRVDSPITGEPRVENPGLINKEQTSNEQQVGSSSSEGEQPERTEAEQVGEFFKFWEQNFPGSLTPLIADDLNDLIKDYGITEVRYAAETAVRMNKRFIRYVAAVCRNRAAGIEPGAQNGHNNADSSRPHDGSRHQPKAYEPVKPGQERFANLLE